MIQSLIAMLLADFLDETTKQAQAAVPKGSVDQVPTAKEFAAWADNKLKTIRITEIFPHGDTYAVRLTDGRVCTVTPPPMSPVMQTETGAVRITQGRSSQDLPPRQGY